MKKLLILLVAVLYSSYFGEARAQTVGGSFGVRLEMPVVIARPSFDYPQLGFQYGLEFGLPEASGSVGGRVSLSSFILLYYRLGLDLYYRAPVGLDGSSLYAGLGYAGAAVIFVNGSYQDGHVLIGYQFGNGFWLEGAVGLGFTDENDPNCTNFPCQRVSVGPFLTFNFSLGWNLLIPLRG